MEEKGDSIHFFGSTANVTTCFPFVHKNLYVCVQFVFKLKRIKLHMAHQWVESPIVNTWNLEAVIVATLGLYDIDGASGELVIKACGYSSDSRQ